MRAISLKQQQLFKPPYCPNPECKYHISKISKDRFYKKNGVLKTKYSTRLNQKYKCKCCNREFCYSTFFLFYRHRRRSIAEEVFSCTTDGMTNISIANKIGCSETTVRRIGKLLKRQGILKWELLVGESKVQEPIVADGFESFVYDQHSINNLHTYIGKQSLFCYHINYAAMNRKGRMTKAQKEKEKKLQEKHGKYDPTMLYQQFKKGLNYIKDNLAAPCCSLFTDEKREYKYAIDNYFKGCFKHYTTNSKEKRDVHNNLFASNNLDLKLRHYLAAFRRETIAFPKNESGYMDKVFLFIVRNNFMRGKYIRPTKNDPERHRRSPGMEIGIAAKIFKFDEFFDLRRTSTQVKIRSQWENYYFDKYNFTRFPTTPYEGI